jgi:hypothetical protein
MFPYPDHTCTVPWFGDNCRVWPVITHSENAKKSPHLGAYRNVTEKGKGIKAAFLRPWLQRAQRLDNYIELKICPKYPQKFRYLDPQSQVFPDCFSLKVY